MWQRLGVPAGSHAMPGDLEPRDALREVLRMNEAIGHGRMQRPSNRRRYAGVCVCANEFVYKLQSLLAIPENSQF